MGISINSCPKPVKTSDPFSIWYANLFIFNRRKCILFYNPTTTLSAFALNVKKPQILKIDQLLREAVETMLVGLEVERSIRSKIMASIDAVQVCRTADKSALACMVQIVYMAEWPLYQALDRGIEMTASDLAFALNADGMVKYKQPTKMFNETVAELGWRG
jgi:hypothetical protein